MHVAVSGGGASWQLHDVVISKVPSEPGAFKGTRPSTRMEGGGGNHVGEGYQASRVWLDCPMGGSLEYTLYIYIHRVSWLLLSELCVTFDEEYV